MPRYIRMVIEQTETFTLDLEVPDDATSGDILIDASIALKDDNVLEFAHEDGNCSTHIKSLEETFYPSKHHTFRITDDADLEQVEGLG